MRIIDRHAYANALRLVDPAHKAAFAFTALLLCLIFNRPLVGVVTLIGTWAMVVYLARIPGAVFGRVLLVEATFLVLAISSIIISISQTRPTEGWGFAVGTFWISSSRAALDTALHLLMRSLGCAAALNLLALTTPVIDLIELLRRLKVSPILIDLMTVMYRYIFVLLDSLEAMVTAQTSRLGYGSFRRSMSSAALIASRLFVEAYRRSQRLETALRGRGYTDDLRVLPLTYQRDPRFLVAGVFLLLVVMVIGFVF